MQREEEGFCTSDALGPFWIPGVWGRRQQLTGISLGNAPKVRATRVFWDHAPIFNQETHSMHQGFPASSFGQMDPVYGKVQKSWPRFWVLLP